MTSYRILIVEDQREVSRLLRSALETLEHDLAVVEFPSAEEALLESSRKKVDLLVADYRLPGMTGIELFHKVRKDHPQVKVILITGQTDPRIRKDVAEAGADAFFIKPVPIAEFLDAVERHLGLVETILPPEPIVVENIEIKPSLPDLLAGLRQALAANAVFLLNDTGSIQARAGNLPDSENENNLVSCLIPVYTAGKQVARIIGQKTPSNWHVFDGGQYDVLFAPVGTTHAMLVIGKELASEPRASRTVEIFSLVRKNIEQILGESAPATPATQEPGYPAEDKQEQNEIDLEPILKDANKKLMSSEVNEFWNNATNEQKGPSKPDMLSYEQAKQLGLTPKGKS